MVPWAHHSPHPKWHRPIHRFGRFCRAHDRDRHTDRQTDHASPSVTIGCIYTILRCGLATRNGDSTSMYSLTFRVRRYTVISTDCQYARRYVVIATQPVPRLQYRPIVHNWGAPLSFPSYTWVRAVVWACGRGQTDRHTEGQTDTHRRA